MRSREGRMERLHVGSLFGWQEQLRGQEAHERTTHGNGDITP